MARTIEERMQTIEQWVEDNGWRWAWLAEWKVEQEWRLHQQGAALVEIMLLCLAVLDAVRAIPDGQEAFKEALANADKKRSEVTDIMDPVLRRRWST